MTPQETKAKAIEILRRRTAEQRERLAEIDQRLADYFDDLCQNSSVVKDDTSDRHGVYEILCAVRFLRLMRTYEFDMAAVKRAIHLREGNWQQDEQGRWQHLSGGLKCPSPTGDTVFRWLPFQVFVLAAIFGPTGVYDTHVRPEDKTTLLPTEFVGEALLQNEVTKRTMAKELTIYDRRRVCTDFVFFTTRKSDKTGMAAYIQFLFFFFGDVNAEIVCCANSRDQSSILYRRTTDLLRQMDNGEALRINASVADWKPAYRGVRKSELRPMSAGGKTKDGMFCQLVVADEFGSAAYINGRADMARLVDVCRSSMGPRREPLTMTTTTAGQVTAGPFIDKLEGLHRMLERELDYDDGTLTPSAEEDRTMCLLFEVDDWERDEDYVLSHPHLWAKVSPALGVMSQYSFYQSEVERAKMEPSVRSEVLSKLFNIYSQGKISMWMKGDKIIPLQRDRRITDCKYADGWSVFVGCDFASLDDFFAISYLAVNYNHQGQTMEGLMFADTEAWILEDALKDSPNRALFEKWVEQGWLQVCPGAVFDSGLAIARLMEKHQQGVNLCGFGYDPAQSKQPINNLKAWLQTLGIGARTIEQMVIPVSQSAMTFNSVIADMEEYILAPVPWVEFSNSPIWPWAFGNCAVELGRTDLRRIIKGNGQANKIDPVMALGDAVYLFALSEGKIENNV